MNCDFCFDPDPAWEFPAQTYIDHKLGAQSMNGWLACEMCAQLVCQNNYEALMERANKNPTMALLISVAGPARAREETMRIHQEFKEHRIGEPRRL